MKRSSSRRRGGRGGREWLSEGLGGEGDGDRIFFLVEFESFFVEILRKKKTKKKKRKKEVYESNCLNPEGCGTFFEKGEIGRETRCSRQRPRAGTKRRKGWRKRRTGQRALNLILFKECAPTRAGKAVKR